MRIALISNIHANLPALRAVLADIANRSGIDATYHLGDLVGYAPWPNETVALLKESGIEGIAGNFVNAGSAGRPKDGDPRAGYVILEADEVSRVVEFVRVEYDLNEAIRGIRESDLPDEFAEHLATGGMPGSSHCDLFNDSAANCSMDSGCASPGDDPRRLAGKASRPG